jgi:acetyl-CoA acyltransferase
MAEEPVIIEAVRSPMGRGKPGGALSSLHPVELLAQVLEGLIGRTGIDPGEVDDVIIGCVSQVGEQSGGVGRMAWLAAGLPEHVPSTTINRMCGSAQQAVHFAAQGIAAGVYDLVIAGGVESMSRVPMGSARLDQDPQGPRVRGRYAPGLVHQGISAELVAARFGLSREALDRYAVRSHRRAAEAAHRGAFERETIPITVGERRVSADETIRPETSLEALGALSPAFANPRDAARFPEIRWSITAGNASQITDGASLLLLASAKRAAALGLRPRARFVAYDVVGDDPLLMLTAPIPATRRVLAKAGLRLEDIDHIEVNEAFAPVPLAWAQALGMEEDAAREDGPARLNPLGGAIALGHPLGATGARLLTSMLHALEREGGRFGLLTMCEAGGMANATIIERL